MKTFLLGMLGVFTTVLGFVSALCVNVYLVVPIGLMFIGYQLFLGTGFFSAVFLGVALITSTIVLGLIGVCISTFLMIGLAKTF